ncbi:MAG: HpsJ family protein [Hormoscilla sp.]
MTPTSKTPQEQLQFLREVLKTTYTSKADTQVMYPLLQEKLSQLDESLAQLLSTWARQQFATVKPATAKALAETLLNFSELVERFPQGSKVNNLAIAIAGYQAALQFFTDHNYSKEFTKTQAALATAKQLRQQIMLLDQKQPRSTPEGWRYSSQKRPREGVYLSEKVEARSNSLWSVAGYFLLVFAVIEYVNIFIPFDWTDPVWDLQTIGRVVSDVWIPLLGLLLVFSRQRGYVAKAEMHLLRLLSWVSLLLGMFYMWMLVLGVGHTWEIYADRGALTPRKIAQPTDTENIERSGNPTEQLASPLSRAPSIENFQKPLQNSVKLNLEAMLASMMFMGIWRLTRWARKFK